MAASASTGSLIHPQRLPVARAVARLLGGNPFEPEWIEMEGAALGSRPASKDEAWGAPVSGPSRNARAIAERVALLVAMGAQELGRGVTGTAEERAVYQRVAIYTLWDWFGPRMQELIDADAVEVPFYDEFVESYRMHLGHPGLAVPEPRHLLALFYQARRAWYFPASRILGASPSAMAARATIYRANMGADVCDYAEDLYQRMDEVPVLITGETGTGKDIAAECIGWSRYIPFDEGARRFVRKYADDFYAKNLCEVPAELLESTLFGHRRGSFTGAIVDTAGYFALPKVYGSLFLDEIGELPLHLQAKLLRPLQNRQYAPLGETRPRKLQGRLIFATHRDLEELCRAGKFRPDLLERMNGFHVRMPPLRQMMAEAPGELRHYVRAFVAGKIANRERVETWTDRVVDSIHATRFGHPWSRNLRELKNYTERYVLSDGRSATPEVSVVAAPTAPAVETAQAAERTPVEERKPAAPRPERPATAGGAESTVHPSSGSLGWRAKAGEMSLEDLDRAYVTWVYGMTDQNQAETARRTKTTWRKVGRLIDPARLVRWLKKPKKPK